MASVAITLGTLSGRSYDFSLPSTASTLEGKLQVAAQLGQPADLQRWLLNGAVLEDGDVIANLQAAGSEETLQVLCVFLPRSFDVRIKVVRFSPGSEAQSAEEVSITVSPAMPIDAAKFEALAAASAILDASSGAAEKTARLIKGGLHLEDAKTIENYNIDPNAILHLVVPRGRAETASLVGNASQVACGISDESSAAACCKKSSLHGNSSEIIKGSGVDEADSKPCLSPRMKEAVASMGKMGVHRLRPRRSASTPALTSNMTNESKAMLEASDDAQDFGSQTSSVATDLKEQEFGPCRPQMPCEQRVARSRPSRSRPASRCATRVRDDASTTQPQMAAELSGRPPKAPVGMKRPPIALLPDTAKVQAESERSTWTSRGQCSATSLFSQDSGSAAATGKATSFAKQEARTWRGQSEQRAASYRTAVIDRWAAQW
jgi:hypothetical protein